MLKIIGPLSLINLFICNPIKVTAQQEWKSITSVEDVCSYYPETIENMLNQFNLDYPGLEKVKSAQKNGKSVDACKELLAYFKNNSKATELLKSLPEKAMPKIKAKIKSENEQEITVSVNTKDKKWMLTIPFGNSSKAKLSSTP